MKEHGRKENEGPMVYRTIRDTVDSQGRSTKVEHILTFTEGQAWYSTRRGTQLSLVAELGATRIVDRWPRPSEGQPGDKLASRDSKDLEFRRAYLHTKEEGVWKVLSLSRFKRGAKPRRRPEYVVAASDYVIPFDAETYPELLDHFAHWKVSRELTPRDGTNPSLGRLPWKVFVCSLYFAHEMTRNRRSERIWSVFSETDIIRQLHGGPQAVGGKTYADVRWAISALFASADIDSELRLFLDMDTITRDNETLYRLQFNPAVSLSTATWIRRDLWAFGQPNADWIEYPIGYLRGHLPGYETRLRDRLLLLPTDGAPMQRDYFTIATEWANLSGRELKRPGRVIEILNSCFEGSKQRGEIADYKPHIRVRRPGSPVVAIQSSTVELTGRSHNPRKHHHFEKTVEAVVGLQKKFKYPRLYMTAQELAAWDERQVLKAQGISDYLIRKYRPHLKSRFWGFSQEFFADKRSPEAKIRKLITNYVATRGREPVLALFMLGLLRGYDPNWSWERVRELRKGKRGKEEWSRGTQLEDVLTFCPPVVVQENAETVRKLIEQELHLNPGILSTQPKSLTQTLEEFLPARLGDTGETPTLKQDNLPVPGPSPSAQATPQTDAVIVRRPDPIAKRVREAQLSYPAPGISTLSSQEARLAKKEFLERIEKAIGKLSPRRAKLLKLYFGLGGEEKHSLEEIGEMYRVSRQAIKKRVDTAIGKLRQIPEAQALKDFL